MTRLVVREARRLTAELRLQEEAELEREHERWRVAHAGVRDAMQALSEAPTPAALVERAPAELGTHSTFARVLLSTIGPEALTAFRAWSRGATESTESWPETIVPLTYPLVEAELLRHGGARLVDVARSDGRTPAALRERLGWGAYVVGVVALNDRPRWMLHAELDDAAPPGAALEVEVVAGFAGALGRSIEVALLRGLLLAHRGEQLRAARSVIQRLESTDLVVHPPEQPGGAATHDELTARERQVVGLMIEGMTNAAIARQLLISGGTVKYHVANVLSKLGASSRADAVARFMRRGA